VIPWKKPTPLLDNLYLLIKIIVNLTNFLPAAFAPIFFRQKIIKPNCNKRKDVQSSLVQKRGK